MDSSSCAFCLSLGSLWSYQLHDGSTVEACETCHNMVDSSNWRGLLRRRMLAHDCIAPMERRDVALEIIHEWALFHLNRRGPAEPAYSSG